MSIVVNKNQIIPGMAHFAGTGPAAFCCGDCRHLIKVRGLFGYRCEKYREMMNRYGDVPIPRTTASCRHFERRTLSIEKLHDR